VFSRRSKQSAYAGRPSVCRNCGVLIGSGEKACAQCGAPFGTNQSGATQRVVDKETMRFARAILSRPYIFTIVFLVANFFVFLLMWDQSGLGRIPVLAFPAETLLAFGAKTNALINAGRIWLFVTPVFIHVGLIHLLVNMYSLWMVGPYVEMLYGSAKFVVFWVATGIAGVVASYLTVQPDLHVNSAVGRFLFKAVDNPSAGASGALFGLVGVLFVFGIKFRHELPEGFKRAFGTGLLPTILVNLFIGYLGEGFIDNAAHVGGFVSGSVLALVAGYQRPDERESASLVWRLLQVSALALVVLSFVMVARNFNRPLPGVPGMAASSANEYGAVDAFVKGTDAGQEAFSKAVDRRDGSAVDSAIAALNKAPHFDDQADAFRDQLVALLVRARKYAASPAANSSGPRLDQEQRAKLSADFDKWGERFKQWVKTDGKKYGIELTTESNPN
jgi:rhomboid protease GluP